ncbi:hypothetical protein B296_00020483 [Ensete ventricosum]|uniref:Uncharacterized protein n=1 Tax=Ensete ventricosum TaxID=4639 RepID=A0A426X0L4_ENSVE|nr:hypothetical protein B296_00020483 [Ensete ventricosum]
MVTEVPLLVEVDAAKVKHKEDYLVEEGQYSIVPNKGCHRMMMGYRLTKRKALLMQVEKKRKQPAMMSDAGCE